MDRFADAEQAWVERLGNLRNAVRQELIGRQLDDHVRGGVSVLDVGCGQGTRAIRLARRRCAVVGVDPSNELLERFASDAAAGLDVDLRPGRLDDLDAVLGDRRFDVVCAHGSALMGC